MSLSGVRLPGVASLIKMQHGPQDLREFLRDT